MKKIILVLIVSFFVMSFVVAGLLLSGNSTIELSRDAYRELCTERGLCNPEVSELVCSGDVCRSCASKEVKTINEVSLPHSVYDEEGEETLTSKIVEIESYELVRMGCVVIDNVGSTNDLLLSRDNAFIEYWENMAQKFIEEENRVYETKIDKGGITLTEKK